MGRVTPGSQANRDCIGGAWQGGTKWSDCPGCAKCLPNGGYVLRKGKWRPTTAHEYIFLFSKSERYFCDGDAVKELTTGNAHSRGNGLNPKANSNGANNNRDRMPKQNDSFSTACTEVVPTRNPRSVWTLSSEPFTGAHFACFPTKIPLKAIEAGTSKAGCCPSCGSCWAPVVDSARVPTRPGQNTKVKILSGWDTKEGPHGTIHREGRTIEAEYTDLSRDVIGNRDPQRHIAITHVSGYRPTCKCPPTDPVPCLVLDPFAGSGTTGQVANALNRDCVLIEVNPKYVELINERVKKPLTKKRNGNRAAPPGKGQKSFSFG
jgi:hypothetical protein